MLNAISFPSDSSGSGAHDADDDVDLVPAGECEATLWEWALYVEDDSEGESDGMRDGSRPMHLRRLCSSDDPGSELATASCSRRRPMRGTKVTWKGM